MAFNVAKPADDDYVAPSVADIRENFRALLEDQIVDAGKVGGKTVGEIGNCKTKVFLANGSFVAPAGASKALVIALGGGGGGGGAGNDGATAGTAGEPGVGMIYEVDLTPGETYDVVIGQGGAKGTKGTAGNPGTAGTSGGWTYLDHGATHLLAANPGAGGFAGRAGANAASSMVDALRIPRTAFGGPWFNWVGVALGGGGCGGGPIVSIDTGSGTLNYWDEGEPGIDGVLGIIYW